MRLAMGVLLSAPDLALSYQWQKSQRIPARGRTPPSTKQNACSAIACPRRRSCCEAGAVKDTARLRGKLGASLMGGYSRPALRLRMALIRGERSQASDSGPRRFI